MRVDQRLCFKLMKTLEYKYDARLVRIAFLLVPKETEKRISVLDRLLKKGLRGLKSRIPFRMGAAVLHNNSSREGGMLREGGTREEEADIRAADTRVVEVELRVINLQLYLYMQVRGQQGLLVCNGGPWDNLRRYRLYQLFHKL